MKKTKLFIALTLTAALFTGCGDGALICERGKGPDVTQTLTLDEFKGIELMIAGDVTIHQDSVFAVTVNGPQNMIDKLDLDVRNDIWRIKYDGCTRGDNDLDIEIHMPTIEYLGLAGSGSIELADSFVGLNALTVKMAGSGEIWGEVSANSIETDIAGSGNIAIGGTAPDAEHKIAGSGEIQCFDLISERSKAEIAGSGNIEVRASETLDATISGSGNIYYKGLPAVTTHISGSGNVTHVD